MQLFHLRDRCGEAAQFAAVGAGVDAQQAVETGVGGGAVLAKEHAGDEDGDNGDADHGDTRKEEGCDIIVDLAFDGAVDACRGEEHGQSQAQNHGDHAYFSLVVLLRFGSFGGLHMVFAHFGFLELGGLWGSNRARLP